MPRLGPNAHLIGRPGSRAQLMTPALVIDLDALEGNIARMAEHARRHGVGLRPHAKTHKSVTIARMQVTAGALGACVATLGEAEVMVEGGVPGVLITTPVVTPAKIARLMALHRRADGLMVVADHLGNVDDLASAAREGGGGLAVTAALDVGGHRIGAAGTDAALAVARRIDEAGSLAFAGIHAYAGPLQHIEDYGERRRRAEDVGAMVGELQEKLDAAGIAPPLVSGAGTGTHDIDALHGPFTELQVGSYIFTDVQYDAVALREDTPRPFEPALFVRTTVVSTNVGGQVTTDGGLKRFASDGPLPEIASGAPDGARYEFKGDEHGRVVFAKDSDSLPLGAAVECLTPHCDPTVNLYDHYHVVRGDTLVDIWPVDGRGVI
jgi:D-serine deaminase-like pyridoxal phosphate-dependent protein